MRRLVLATALLLLAATAAALDWEYVGMDGVSATTITVDPLHELVFVGTHEGFHFLDLPTDTWTERDWEDWIGRQVYAVDFADDLPGRVITGRENAWFKGYLEVSDDLGPPRPSSTSPPAAGSRTSCTPTSPTTGPAPGRTWRRASCCAPPMPA